MTEQTKSAEETKHHLIKCVVTSDSMAKSRVARVERLVKHPRMGKYIRRNTKLMFHDEQNTSKVGDEVLVTPYRPMSARKRFNLYKVVKSVSE